MSRNLELVQQGLNNAHRSVEDFADSGTRLIAGTDSPIFPYGLSLITELQNYVAAGLTPSEALKTATSAAADELGAADYLGRLAPGKRADLLIIDGNPLAKITDLLATESVILNGRYLPMETLLSGPEMQEPR